LRYGGKLFPAALWSAASVAAEYLLTGKFMTAEKAAACGLISEIVPHEALLDKALALPPAGDARPSRRFCRGQGGVL
jgi:enoyl-CoA hydratase/carnithine racemase